jgi:hypothetical protein
MCDDRVITDYMIVESLRVVTLLGDGWQPWGPLTVFRDCEGMQVVWQVVVKYGDAPAVQE